MICALLACLVLVGCGINYGLYQVYAILKADELRGAESLRYLYLFTPDREIAVIDASDRLNMRSESPQPFGFDVFKSTAFGGYIYVACGHHGVKIVDVSNPRAVDITGTAISFDARDVLLLDKYLYVADGDAGLVVYDVSDQRNPLFVYSAAVGSRAIGVLSHEEATNTIVLVCEDTVAIFDASVPASPTKKGSVGLDSVPSGFDMVSSHVFIAAEQLHAIDIRDREEPSIVASTVGSAIDCIVHAGSSAVRIVAVSKFSNIELFAFVPARNEYLYYGEFSLYHSREIVPWNSPEDIRMKADDQTIWVADGSTISLFGNIIHPYMLDLIGRFEVSHGIKTFVHEDLLDDPAPREPSELTATAETPDLIRLSWADNSTNEIGYEIKRQSADSVWETIAETEESETQFDDTAILPDTTYRYRLRALGRREDSAYSLETSISTPPS